MFETVLLVQAAWNLLSNRMTLNQSHPAPPVFIMKRLKLVLTSVGCLHSRSKVQFPTTKSIKFSFRPEYSVHCISACLFIMKTLLQSPGPEEKQKGDGDWGGWGGHDTARWLCAGKDTCSKPADLNSILSSQMSLCLHVCAHIYTHASTYICTHTHKIKCKRN